MERCEVMGMGRKYELVGVAVGRGVWKEFLQKGRDFDTVSSAKSRYHANEIWRDQSQNRYFITSYGKGVRSKGINFNIYQRVWLTEEDVRELEKSGRLLKKWIYKVYEDDKIVSEGTILEEDVEELIETLLRRLKKEGLIKYKDYFINIDSMYLKEYDKALEMNIRLALETRLDSVFMGYYWDLIDVWTKVGYAKSVYFRKGIREWGELRIFDYVVKFERSFNP